MRIITYRGIRFTECGPMLRAPQVTEIEKTHGVRLPDSYKNFLLSANGGRPRPSGYRLISDPEPSIGVTYDGMIEARNSGARIPRDWHANHPSFDELLNARAAISKVTEAPDYTSLITIAFDYHGMPICMALCQDFYEHIYLADEIIENIDVGGQVISGSTLAELEEVSLIAKNFDEFLDGLFPARVLLADAYTVPESIGLDDFGE